MLILHYIIAVVYVIQEVLQDFSSGGPKKRVKRRTAAAGQLK